MNQHTKFDEAATVPAAMARAAEYVRMSTDHQRYSTANQADAIREYAARRGLTIVKTYADHGKSGLSIAGRDALQTLLDDVRAGRADFQTILVYDVSRWGRFQDADESAYYEYVCKRAGIQVQYCAEQFDNDGSPISTIVKGVKRAMASEYSRELSTKVFAGQCRLIELGYRQGGQAGYGLRRQLTDGAGTRKGELSRGEQKSIQTDRVVLMPGPPDEVETVRWIYRTFVESRRSEREIAEALNARGIQTDMGRPWTRGTVHQVLINDKYVGDNVWNRVSVKLHGKRVQNASDMWVRRDGAFEGLVDRMLFSTAQAIIRHAGRAPPDYEGRGPAAARGRKWCHSGECCRRHCRGGGGGHSERPARRLREERAEGGGTAGCTKARGAPKPARESACGAGPAANQAAFRRCSASHIPARCRQEASSG